VSRSRPASWSLARTSILLATAAFLAGGLASQLRWYRTGDSRWTTEYFQTVGALIQVSLAGLAAWFSYRVSWEFSRRDPLLAAWRLIALSALVDFFGQAASHILAVNRAFNPLVHQDWWSPGIGEGFREWGLFLNGPCRFAFLALGLYYAVEVYRKSGFLGKFRGLNWPVIIAMGIYLIVEGAATAAAIWRGKGPGLPEIAHYPTDPLLFVLLIQAMLLYRSAEEMGGGWVGDCWKSIGIGIIFVSMGDMLLLATNYGYLSWPWSSIEWYVWFPAAAAFAIAPTYQLDAIVRARAKR
jgi:hypothetical protein